MSWVTPRTWTPGETVTAALMNAHLRDELNVLKTSIDDTGYLRPLIKGFGYSAGQSNGATTGSDVQLTSFDTTIPAGCLAQPGDALIVEGVIAVASNANAKALKLQIASGTLVTVWSSSVSGGGTAAFRAVIRRRSQTTGSLNGDAKGPAAHGSTTAPTYYANSTVGSVDWAVAQTLKFFANAVGANDVTLAEVYVNSARSNAGTLV